MSLARISCPDEGLPEKKKRRMEAPSPAMELELVAGGKKPRPQSAQSKMQELLGVDGMEDIPVDIPSHLFDALKCEVEAEKLSTLSLRIVFCLMVFALLSQLFFM